MPVYPKFQAKVQEQIVNPTMRQATRPGYALVLRFDRQMNTCDVVTALQGSDELGEVIPNVPAPVQAGVQTVAPKPGTFCWIAYRDGTTANPYITHFFNNLFYENDYPAQYKATMDVPRFMLSL